MAGKHFDTAFAVPFRANRATHLLELPASVELGLDSFEEPGFQQIREVIEEEILFRGEHALPVNDRGPLRQFLRDRVIAYAQMPGDRKRQHECEQDKQDIPRGGAQSVFGLAVEAAGLEFRAAVLRDLEVDAVQLELQLDFDLIVLE
jgi:hypothetical protein